MELHEIVDRYARSLEYADAHFSYPSITNQRNGHLYAPGFFSLRERDAVDYVIRAWEILATGSTAPNVQHRQSVKYSGLSKEKFDHQLAVQDSSGNFTPEWSIEVKRLQLIGNNGKRNDYAVGKTLSPYLKDRGLLHDALRLRDNAITPRAAVVGYVYHYDTLILEKMIKYSIKRKIKDLRNYVRSESVTHAVPDHARRQIDAILKSLAEVGPGIDLPKAILAENSPFSNLHQIEMPAFGSHLVNQLQSNAETISNAMEVVKDNGGRLRADPLVQFSDAIMNLRGLVIGAREQKSFSATLHPAGAEGLVFGWEVYLPARDPDFDPLHPW